MKRIGVFSVEADLHAHALLHAMRDRHDAECHFIATDALARTGGIRWSPGAKGATRLRSRDDAWVDVASVSELIGPQPLARKIVAEHIAGWAITTEEHNVFVLPAKNNQVLSAVCPHEGCEVAWDQNRNRFSCPCHESYFAADGARISGPAPHGLDPLPMRVQEGKLQVQYVVMEQAGRA